MLILYLLTALLVFILSFFLTLWIAKSDKPLWKKISWVVLDIVCSLLWLPILFGLSVFTVIKSIKTNFPKKNLES